MTALTIVGGVYHELCVWPDWDRLFGSGGRAAAAVAGYVDYVTLYSYAETTTATAFGSYARAYDFSFRPVASDETISFEYVHSLSVPVVRPPPVRIHQLDPIVVNAEVALRFGMMEGSAQVTANRCVYDPQSAFKPEPFSANGSSAAHLAIVGNRGEITAMGGNSDPIAAARALLSCGAEVVIVKLGPAGASVVQAAGVTEIPSYQTERVWKIGSGDVFAALFAACWGVNGDAVLEAARLASRGVAEYVESMSLPVPPRSALQQQTRSEARIIPSSIYLAGPFFTVGQRWLVDEARRCLMELDLTVFSPAHEVGPGHATMVAAADLSALDACEAAFAILDGLDSGTLFEVGYARARNKPVYVLAQTVSEHDLKMVLGSGCMVFDDLVTALHHAAWRT
jgi:Nucleoside 2-deoxyribosyltransferase/pfkB family carbohydrate kinase